MLKNNLNELKRKKRNRIEYILNEKDTLYYIDKEKNEKQRQYNYNNYILSYIILKTRYF